MDYDKGLEVLVKQTSSLSVKQKWPKYKMTPETQVCYPKLKDKNQNCTQKLMLRQYVQTFDIHNMIKEEKHGKLFYSVSHRKAHLQHISNFCDVNL